jgi:hypothetical protein
MIGAPAIISPPRGKCYGVAHDGAGLQRKNTVASALSSIIIVDGPATLFRRFVKNERGRLNPRNCLLP